MAPGMLFDPLQLLGLGEIPTGPSASGLAAARAGVGGSDASSLESLEPAGPAALDPLYRQQLGVLAPQVGGIVENAVQRQQRRGARQGAIASGVAPLAAQLGAHPAGVLEFLGILPSGTVPGASMIGAPSQNPSEPPMSEEELLALQQQIVGGQPSRGSQSLGVSLPPATDLSGYRRQLGAMEGTSEELAQSGGRRRTELGQAFDAEEKAIQRRAEIAENRQQQVTAALTELEGGIARNEEQRKAREEAASKAVADRMGAFNKAVEAANSASIDPDRWYRDSSGGTFGRRLGSSIAMALGAMGAAFTKGPNYAMQIIDGAIQRDLMAQRAELAKKQTGVGLAQNAVALAREQFRDESARGAAEQAAMLARAERMIALATAQSGSEEEKAKGDALVAGMQTRRADLMGKAEEAEKASEFGRQTQLAQLELQGAQVRGADAKLRWQAQQTGRGGGGGLRGLVPADPANPPSKAQMVEAQKEYAKYQRVQTALARAIQLRGSDGWKLKTPREQKAVLSQLASAMASYQGLPGESKKEVFSNPEKVVGIADLGEVGAVLDHLKAMQQSVRADFEAGMGAAGGAGLVLQDVQSMPGARRVK